MTRITYFSLLCCNCYSFCIFLLNIVGRYLYLNAIANQLRYPNSHTHYFSCTLLYLFAEANSEAIQEQITRYVCDTSFAHKQWYSLHTPRTTPHVIVEQISKEEKFAQNINHLHILVEVI